MDHPQISLPMQKKDKPCPFIDRRGWCIKGQECDFSHANLVNNLDLCKPVKTRKVKGPKPSSFWGNQQRNNIISLMNQLETSLQEIESTQTLHARYPPPSTTATSLSRISSSVPKPLDGNSSVPFFLSPTLRSHNSINQVSPLTLVTLIQEIITKEITFSKVSQNRISCPRVQILSPAMTNPNLGYLLLLEVDRM